jgi:hypothetical protein
MRKESARIKSDPVFLWGLHSAELFAQTVKMTLHFRLGKEVAVTPRILRAQDPGDDQLKRQLQPVAVVFGASPLSIFSF